MTDAPTLSALHKELTHRAVCLWGLTEGAVVLFEQTPIQAPNAAGNALLPLLDVIVREARAVADELEAMERLVRQTSGT